MIGSIIGIIVLALILYLLQYFVYLLIKNALLTKGKIRHVLAFMLLGLLSGVASAFVIAITTGSQEEYVTWIGLTLGMLLSCAIALIVMAKHRS